MGYTISQKIIARAAGVKDVIPGDVVYVKPDLIMLYDWPGFDGLMRDIRVDPSKVAINLDHFFMPNSEAAAKLHRNYRTTVQKYNIQNFYDIGNSGIGFQLMVEKGHIRPGMLAIHIDPHVSTFGAFGAYCLGVGADIMSAFLIGEVWLRVPKTIKVNATGTFVPGVTSRDLFEKVVADVGPDGAIGSVIEYDGDGIEGMSAESRMVICNSVQYVSAETAIINPDKRAIEYLGGKGKEQGYQMMLSDPDAVYAKVIDYDLARLEPMVVTPPDVYCVQPLRQVEGKEINQALLGTCASGRLEDLRLAAKMLKGRKVHPNVRFLVTPITQQTFKEAANEGLIGELIQAGAQIGPATCGPCYGGIGYLLPGETCIATGTLNIPGRMGSTEAGIYLASAATVTASAITGNITDPRKFFQ